MVYDILVVCMYVMYCDYEYVVGLCLWCDVRGVGYECETAV